MDLQHTCLICNHVHVINFCNFVCWKHLISSNACIVWCSLLLVSLCDPDHLYLGGHLWQHQWSWETISYVVKGRPLMYPDQISHYRTIASKYFFIQTCNKDYFFIPYGYAILLSYTTKPKVKCFAIYEFHKIYVHNSKGGIMSSFLNKLGYLSNENSYSYHLLLFSYLYKSFNLVLLPYRYAF